MDKYFKLVGIVEYFKILFDARSTYHLFVILLVFSISGSASLLISKYILGLLQLDASEINLTFYWLIKIPIIIFSYQFILLAVAAAFGEFKHFSKYSLKFLSLLKNIFRRG